MCVCVCVPCVCVCVCRVCVCVCVCVQWRSWGQADARAYLGVANYIMGVFNC